MAGADTSGQGVDLGILSPPVLWDLWSVQNSLLELRRTPGLAAAPWVYHVTAQPGLKLGGNQRVQNRYLGNQKPTAVEEKEAQRILRIV